MKVHEKMTYATKVNHKTRGMIRPTESDEDKLDEDELLGGDKTVAVKEDPQFVIAVTRGSSSYSWSFVYEKFTLA